MKTTLEGINSRITEAEEYNTIKLLEGNIGRTFFNINDSNSFRFSLLRQMKQKQK